jgi:hypothetical protein
MIEIGRYKNLETEERLCKLCITQQIEDAYNFLIDCPIYNNSRKICYHKPCFSFLVSRHSIIQFPKILIIERSSFGK